MDAVQKTADHYRNKRLVLIDEIDRLNHEITRKIEELTNIIALELAMEIRDTDNN